ncbi:hypothetical protein DL96DRAFT_866960 [Flagelloscypha sp. PMI_526]|nr:hypothetical protein DL96DRAFT_866960 [Flagelloscypha sp. PMI_526]
MPIIVVRNKHSTEIDVFVSNYTTSKGNEDWFTLQPEGEDSWQRDEGWELVAFRVNGNGIHAPRKGEYIQVNQGRILIFHSMENIQII